MHFSDLGFVPPAIDLTQGVAAIDLVTLELAAQTVVDELGLPMALPPVCDRPLPEVFTDLAAIDLLPGPVVVATIDTQKMTWDCTDGQVVAAVFTGYDEARHLGVWIGDCWFARVSGFAVGRAPMRLPNGRRVMMWFADVPLTTLEELDLYGLTELAGSLCADWAGETAEAPLQMAPTGKPVKEEGTNHRGDEADAGGAGSGHPAVQPVILDYVKIPAQQIKYRRHLPEIVAINPGVVKDVIQQVFMALDETGARVKTVTAVAAAAMPLEPAPPRHHTFGANHPVMFWLTEPGGDPTALPFAVIVTTAEAWLDPDTKVSFDDTEFSFADPD